MDRKFGRIPEFDERSRSFPIRALLPAKAPRSYTWRCGIVLDQGNDSSCTGMAVSHEAAARPVEVLGINEAIATEVYHRAQELDEWPGEDYEGSSVLAAMKAGMERKWYGGYRWGFGIADALLAISYHGPGVGGTNFYEGMEETDRNGFAQVTGKILGGHAYIYHGVNVKGQYVKFLNSWGLSYGVNGVAKLSFADFDRLLREDGEICFPTLRLKPK